MITIKNIRKLPKYMIAKIKRTDLYLHPEQSGQTRFYAYYTLYNKELAEVIVAVRNCRQQWYCKQVVVHGIHNYKCYVKDIMFNNMCGYKVGWYPEGLTRYPKWYENKSWGWCDDKYFRIFNAVKINVDFILSLPRYKYSCVDRLQYDYIFKFLRCYEEYPQVEYLVKAGLIHYATKKTLLEKCKKDKQFCKWLYQNREELKNNYYVSSILYAYRHKKSIKAVHKFEYFKRRFCHEGNYEELKQEFTGERRKMLMEYLYKNLIDGQVYNDYLKACKYLKLDMKIDKNAFPHDFTKWHDIRIDQYASAKALADEQEKKELYKKFESVANKYISLQRDMNEDLIVIIAKSPAELIKEGEKLHHCVGRMNYDQKFAKEKSLIFFIREKNMPNKPFITLEYSLENHKVLQCYGNYNSRPDEKTLEFINKTWLPYANRKLKKIA